MVNIWHDISPLRITKDSFCVCIEIQKGDRYGYQIDKESGMLGLSQILCAAARYPLNGGFIPRTLTDASTPLGAVIIIDEPLIPLSLVKCHAIGAFRISNGRTSETRIIAMPDIDPTGAEYQDLSNLPRKIREELKRFFEIVQMLEGTPNYHVQWLDAKESQRLLSDAIQHYEERY